MNTYRESATFVFYVRWYKPIGCRLYYLLDIQVHQRIQALRHIEKVRNQDFEVIHYEGKRRNREPSGYNRMVIRIKGLIRDVYKADISKLGIGE